MGLKRFDCLWWNLTKRYWRCSLFSWNKEGNLILFDFLSCYCEILPGTEIFIPISLSRYGPIPEYAIQGKEKNITFLIEKQQSFTFYLLIKTHKLSLAHKLFVCKKKCSFPYNNHPTSTKHVIAYTQIFKYNKKSVKKHPWISVLRDLQNHRRDLWLSVPASLQENSPSSCVKHIKEIN